jgi:hypothetical protein
MLRTDLRRRLGVALWVTLLCAASARGQDEPIREPGSSSSFQDQTSWSLPSVIDSQRLSYSQSYPTTYGEVPWPASGYGRLGDLPKGCDACPNRGLYVFLGYDSWRGVQDGSWDNNGISTGLNFGTRLGRFSDWTGIGFQIGGSVGAYDWNGTAYRLQHQDQAEPQGFVTYGFFRKATENCPWSAAVVQDWMVNANFSVFAQNPTLGQWRGQLGYAISPWLEYGVWGTWRGQGDTRLVPAFGPTTWRPVEQLNIYGHYKWGGGGPDTWLWFGVPEHARLTGNGSLGDYTVGALANAPLGDRIMLYALVTYLHPSASPGPAGQRHRTAHPRRARSELLLEI